VFRARSSLIWRLRQLAEGQKAPALCKPFPRVLLEQANRANLRMEPGREEMVMRTLEAGELLRVRDCRGHEEDAFVWWEVIGEDGPTGWVATNWLAEVEMVRNRGTLFAALRRGSRGPKAPAKGGVEGFALHASPPNGNIDRRQAKPCLRVLATASRVG